MNTIEEKREEAFKNIFEAAQGAFGIEYDLLIAKETFEEEAKINLAVSAWIEYGMSLNPNDSEINKGYRMAIEQYVKVINEVKKGYGQIKP